MTPILWMVLGAVVSDLLTLMMLYFMPHFRRQIAYRLYRDL